VTEQLAEAIRAIHAQSAIVVPHDVNASVDAVSAAFRLADDTVSPVDLHDRKQLATHSKGSSSVVTLAKARVHSRAMRAWSSCSSFFRASLLNHSRL